MVSVAAAAATLALAGCGAGDAGAIGEAHTGSEALPPCSSLEAPAPGGCTFDTRGSYTSKEPYAPRQDPASVEPVPDGFELISVQHVARHGSRALSSADDDDLMLQLWRVARQEGALTPLGETLGPVLEDIRRVHARVGYGRTSGLGLREHEETAQRLLARHRGFFEGLVRDGGRIDVHHSGRTRAAESAEAFVRGMTFEMPELAPLVEPSVTAVETLYFNEAEGSEAYQAYSGGDPRMLEAVGAIENDPRTRTMARLMLRQLFTDAFLNRLADGTYTLQAEADPEDRIENELDAAEALFGLYSIAVGMRDDADWAFGRFIHPDAVAWFAYVDDAGSFYDRGPGFADEDITFAGARALAEDMLARIEGVASGNATHPVTLRFSHAQALMPLAAWLGIAGASQGAQPGELYTYENNPWRSATVSPMGANVQWDAVRNAEGLTLVRMLHNEGEVAFAEGCRPWREGSFFVEVAELRRCYGME